MGRSGYTTGIGSLPHHNVDAALEHSFRYDIPFLPQIPIRNPREYMIPAALDGLPGLSFDETGAAAIDIESWQKGSGALEEKLNAALEGQGLEGFEPGAEVSSCWTPFLWEVRERRVAQAKVQVAGPVTCQWVARLSDDKPIEAHGALAAQILKLVTVKAFALVQALRKTGTQPVIFLDEPGLYAFHRSNPKHLLALQEFRILVTALKKKGALVGVHCCSNTDWKVLLESGLNFISCDTGLSLSRLLEEKDGVSRYLKEGQCLSLGVIPTDLSARHRDPDELSERLLGLLGESFRGHPELLQTVLRHALLTPACGLALKSVGEAESIFADLQEIQSRLGGVS